MYLNTRIFPPTGYARVLLFMFIRRELGGTGTGCYFSLHTVFLLQEKSSRILNFGPRGCRPDVLPAHAYCNEIKLNLF